MLYELPDEATDVTDDQPAVANRLADELSAFLETLGRPYSDEQRTKELSASARQSLKDMGYLVD